MSVAPSVAYVDTSVFVAMAFGEPGATRMTARLQQYELLLSSALLEAELASAHAREGRPFPDELLAVVSTVLPDRRLTIEIAQVLATGYQRGADCFHLATALYVAPRPSELAFLTLDAAQRKVATALGFVT